MSLVVATLRYRLVVASPRRPGEDVLDRGKRSPDHAAEEATNFGDGQGDQLDDGVDAPPAG